VSRIAPETVLSDGRRAPMGSGGMTGAAESALISFLVPTTDVSAGAGEAPIACWFRRDRSDDELLRLAR
jgi:hypothetical protein